MHFTNGTCWEMPSQQDPIWDVIEEKEWEWRNGRPALAKLDYFLGSGFGRVSGPAYEVIERLKQHEGCGVVTKLEDVAAMLLGQFDISNYDLGYRYVLTDKYLLCYRPTDRAFASVRVAYAELEGLHWD